MGNNQGSVDVKTIIENARHSRRAIYIESYEILEEVVDVMKRAGCKIVHTAGVYDMFHPGHILYLEKAKECGDILIVGLDSDELTRRRKSKPNEDRPFDKFDDRLLMVQRSAADIVTIRDVDHDTNDLLKLIRPDVLILSETTGDFETAVDELKPFCGDIRVLERQWSGSTTAKIRRLMTNGAAELAEFLKSDTDEFSRAIQEFVKSNVDNFTKKLTSFFHGEKEGEDKK